MQCPGLLGLSAALVQGQTHTHVSGRAACNDISRSELPDFRPSWELPKPCTYHWRVRTLLIALMIALLPLRGWVGDAMALSMALSHMDTGNRSLAAAPIQSPCHSTQVEAAEQDRHDHGSHGMATGAGHGHLLCDLCNGPVLDSPWLWSPATSEPPQLLPPTSERFASQTARRDVRPPIS